MKDLCQLFITIAVVGGWIALLLLKLPSSDLLTAAFVAVLGYNGYTISQTNQVKKELALKNLGGKNV